MMTSPGGSGSLDDDTGGDPDADPEMMTSGAAVQPDQAEGDDTAEEPHTGS